MMGSYHRQLIQNAMAAVERRETLLVMDLGAHATAVKQDPGGQWLLLRVSDGRVIRSFCSEFDALSWTEARSSRFTPFVELPEKVQHRLRGW